MKTTIEIADPLLDEAKRLAEREGTTLRALVEDGLRAVVARRSQRRAAYELPDHTFGEGGLREGLDWAGWPAIRDEIYPPSVKGQ